MTTTCYVVHDSVYVQSSGRAREALEQDGVGSVTGGRGSIAEAVGRTWRGKRLATHRSCKEARETGGRHADDRGGHGADDEGARPSRALQTV